MHVPRSSPAVEYPSPARRTAPADRQTGWERCPRPCWRTDCVSQMAVTRRESDRSLKICIDLRATECCSDAWTFQNANLRGCIVQPPQHKSLHKAERERNLLARARARALRWQTAMIIPLGETTLPLSVSTEIFQQRFTVKHMMYKCLQDGTDRCLRSFARIPGHPPAGYLPQSYTADIWTTDKNQASSSQKHSS